MTTTRNLLTKAITDIRNFRTRLYQLLESGKLVNEPDCDTEDIMSYSDKKDAINQTCDSAAARISGILVRVVVDGEVIDERWLNSILVQIATDLDTAFWWVPEASFCWEV